MEMHCLVRSLELTPLSLCTAVFLYCRYDEELGIVYMAARLAGGYAAARRALNEVVTLIGTLWFLRCIRITGFPIVIVLVCFSFGYHRSKKEIPRSRPTLCWILAQDWEQLPGERENSGEETDQRGTVGLNPGPCLPPAGRRTPAGATP